MEEYCVARIGRERVTRKIFLNLRQSRLMVTNKGKDELRTQERMKLMSGRLDLCWLPLFGALTCRESWRKRLDLANGITLKHSFTYLLCFDRNTS